jgi:hypothetical protein
MTKKKLSRQTNRREREQLPTLLTGSSKDGGNETGYKTAYITLQDIPQSKIPEEGSEYGYSCEDQYFYNENKSEPKPIQIKGTVISKYNYNADVNAIKFEKKEEFGKEILPEPKQDTTTGYIATLGKSVDYVDYMIRFDTNTTQDTDDTVFIIPKNACGIKINYTTPKLVIKPFERVSNPETAYETQESLEALKQLQAQNLSGAIMNEEQEEQQTELEEKAAKLPQIKGNLNEQKTKIGTKEINLKISNTQIICEGDNISSEPLDISKLSNFTDEELKNAQCKIQRQVQQGPNEVGIVIANYDGKIIARKFGEKNILEEKDKKVSVVVPETTTNVVLVPCNVETAQIIRAPEAKKGGAATIKSQKTRRMKYRTLKRNTMKPEKNRHPARNSKTHLG